MDERRSKTVVWARAGRGISARGVNGCTTLFAAAQAKPLTAPRSGTRLGFPSRKQDRMFENDGEAFLEATEPSQAMRDLKTPELSPCRSS